MLYVRIVGDEDGVTYGCYNLGRILDGTPPDGNSIPATTWRSCMATARKEYILTRVGVNGNFVGQTIYASIKSPPFLRKLQDGALQIVGAARQEPVAKVSLQDAPKLSDRPPGFPK